MSQGSPQKSWCYFFKSLWKYWPPPLSFWTLSKKFSFFLFPPVSDKVPMFESKKRGGGGCSVGCRTTLQSPNLSFFDVQEEIVRVVLARRLKNRSCLWIVVATSRKEGMGLLHLCMKYQEDQNHWEYQNVTTSDKRILSQKISYMQPFSISLTLVTIREALLIRTW